ncbi:hypothetical protein CLV30_11874 [Haloactinopolyspora alba]|uniref:Uncharacterized protein n=1 Tax=Haloactinopolyspora alba TaxID=648780 RepID=A0A2P8DPP2_9ACTN|nr:hypothetical protein [Haloactinopolyspora alba]PSK99173.1 hypothetical protein CLV30_11874 [Haloactinopolyspora alba]
MSTGNTASGAPRDPAPETTDTEPKTDTAASPPPAVNSYDWTDTDNQINEALQTGHRLRRTERTWHVARDRAIAYAPTGGALVAVFAGHIPEPIRTMVGLLGVGAGALAEPAQNQKELAHGTRPSTRPR